MLGKRVKKLIYQNKFTLEDISRILQEPIEKCLNSYEEYTGQKIPPTILIAGNSKQQENLKKLILNNEKVLLFGSHGVGKSSAIRKIGDELQYRIIESYPRSNEDLMEDWGDLPFNINKSIFVMEGDGFYWRKYGLIKKYIEKSKNPIIVIVNKKNTVHGTVEKLLMNVMFSPPSRQEVASFLKKKFPDWNGNINDVYDRDVRVTLRKIKFDIDENLQIDSPKTIDSRQLVYKIFNGTATKEDIENCKDPVQWAQRSIAYNAKNFYSKKTALEVLDKVCFVDKYKYNYNRDFLNGVLLSIPRREKSGKIQFPPYPYKPKNEEEETVEHKKNVLTEKQQEKLSEYISDDMIL